MGTEGRARGYGAIYGRLLRLYPRPFRERFGEGMAQTFADLCRERRQAGRSVAGLAAWVFVETLAGAMRENGGQMTPMGQTIRRVALVALGLLMVPLVASRIVEGWNWPPQAFVLTYVLFFLTGMAYALIARTMNAWAYKAGVGLALAAGFVLGWSTMVHMSETENPLLLVYFGVLAVGAAGAAVARLEARGMSRALFAMVGALAVAGVVTQVVWRHEGAGPAWEVVVRHAGMAAVLTTAGLLFRRASLADSK